MPRVSAAHRAAREQQILDAARRCFADNGFHATSMDDVIREAGLSAGAVYRYYASKDDLIVAAAASAMSAIQGTLGDLLDQRPTPRPAQVLAAVFGSAPLVPGPDGVDITRIALHGWSETTRNPRLAELVHTAYAHVLSQTTELLRLWRAEGLVPAHLDPTATAPLGLSLLLGYVVQRAVLGSAVDPEVYQRAVAALLESPPD